MTCVWQMCQTIQNERQRSSTMKKHRTFEYLRHCDTDGVIHFATLYMKLHLNFMHYFYPRNE